MSPRKYLPALALLLFFSRSASAIQFHVSVVGGLTVTGERLGPSPPDYSLTAAPRPGGTGGVLLGLDLPFGLSLETGMLYLPVSYNLTQSGTFPPPLSIPYSVTFTESFNMFHFPLLLRYALWFHPNLSVAFGFYYSRGFGLITDYFTPPQSGTFEAWGSNPNDGGIETGVAYQLPVTEHLRVLFDARFAASLSNFSVAFGYAYLLNGFFLTGLTYAF